MTSAVERFALAVRSDLPLDVRWFAARALTALLPTGAAARTRARLLRLAGLSIGERTVVASAFTLIGGADASRHLEIGSDCYINDACVFDATAPIRLGDRVSLGHGVLITTSSHLMGATERRAGRLQPRPVEVGDGAWLASRAVILPGVVIGPGAVVGAGAVVTRSVAPNTLVGGVPATEIRRLDVASDS